MAKLLETKRKINALVRKSKVTEDGFSYICVLDGFQCVGRKAILDYLKTAHETKYQELAAGFEDDKEFQSQISKLVMSVPYSSEPANVTKEKEEENGKEAEDEIVVEEAVINPNYPLTLDYMKAIDARTTKIPNYGSLVGRIGRLLGLLLWKENGKIFSMKCDHREIDKVEDIFPHIQAEFPAFLEALEQMFPPAKKRMGQFIEKAVETCDLRVPTWSLVEKLQKEESDRVAAVEKKERDERMAKAKKEREEREAKAKVEREERAAKVKAAREELAKKKKEEEEKRKEQAEKKIALKRKQAEEQRLTDLKHMKLSPNIERVDEIMKIKKEVCRIEKALEGKFIKDGNKARLKEKLAEEKEKLKQIVGGIKQKRVESRLEHCLENLSPKQLRKLCMEYFNKIHQLDSISWTEMCQSVKIDGDYEYLTDFLASLYEMAMINQSSKKGFKVGHVLVTSKQTDEIVNFGLRSIRDNIQDTFRIPDSWSIAPDRELGDKWSVEQDRQLLIGAARFGKNLIKIVTENTELTPLCLEDSGIVKETVRRRFGFLINMYVTRGKPAAEFGSSLYSVDVEGGEEIIEEEEVVEKEEEEVMEITEIKEDIKEGKDAEENKDLETLAENNADEEEVDEKLLDEAD